jgi:hypothetical protein
MKSVRTQEESLDHLRNRRKGVASKADAAERKLNRMDSGHKDTATQTVLLEGLRNTIRELDSEIMTGEAKLADLKRTSTKVWMTLKFGGLQECCRKGVVRFYPHVCSSPLMGIFRSSLKQESLLWPSFLSWLQSQAFLARSTRVMLVPRHM